MMKIITSIQKINTIIEIVSKRLRRSFLSTISMIVQCHQSIVSVLSLLSHFFSLSSFHSSSNIEAIRKNSNRRSRNERSILFDIVKIILLSLLTTVSSSSTQNDCFDHQFLSDRIDQNRTHSFVKRGLFDRYGIFSSGPFQSQLSPSITNESYFEEPNQEIYFSHMVINESIGFVYIGAVNQIYQLDLNLKPIEKIIMGPREDSNDCPISKGCMPDIQKRLSNYYNKALVFDNQHQWLISCGSLFQGTCTAHSLMNVSRIVDQPTESVVANNDSASTVAFIAPGPEPHKQVLYVGATFTAGSYRSDLPVVSSRSLFENSKLIFFFFCFCFHFCFLHPRILFGTNRIVKVKRIDANTNKNKEKKPIEHIFILYYYYYYFFLSFSMTKSNIVRAKKKENII